MKDCSTEKLKIIFNGKMNVFSIISTILWIDDKKEITERER